MPPSKIPFRVRRSLVKKRRALRPLNERVSFQPEVPHAPVPLTRKNLFGWYADGKRRVVGCFVRPVAPADKEYKKELRANRVVELFSFDEKHAPTLVCRASLFVDDWRTSVLISNVSKPSSLKYPGSVLSTKENPKRKGTGYFLPMVDAARELARFYGISQVHLSTLEPKLVKYYSKFGFKSLPAPRDQIVIDMVLDLRKK